jgi:hypothetical protein
MVFGTRTKLPRFLRAGFLLLVVQLGGTAAYAQSTGEIRLQVKDPTDPTGAALQASGHVSGPSADRTFRTDARGAVSLGDLEFGQYRLEVSRPGFASRYLTIDVNTPAPVPEVVTLRIQSASTSVTVVSPTPIGQGDQSLDEIPVPVQGLTSKNLEDSNSLDLADLMNKRLTSVYVNENAGNPYQPDINYRGYTASPLLGTPEGLSVYLDGVRQTSPSGISSRGI